MGTPVEHTAIIRKVPNKKKWKVLSEKGKNLGEYDSRAEAERRLSQIEMFKHMKKKGKGKKHKSSEPLELFNEYLAIVSGDLVVPVFGKDKLAKALDEAAKTNPRLASIIRRENS